MTEILEPGPEVDEAGQRAVADAFLSSARRSAVAVLSGSVPRGFATGAAILGNTGGLAPGSTDPNANFTY